MEKVMADKAYISLVQLQTVWGAKAGSCRSSRALTRTRWRSSSRLRPELLT